MEAQEKSPGRHSLDSQKNRTDVQPDTSSFPHESTERNGTGHANDRHGYRFDLIPESLRDFPHWGVWLPEWRNGTLGNAPYSLRTGAHLSVTDPETWSPFAVALAAYQRGTGGQWGGLTFVVPHASGMVGLDLDACVDDNGTLDPEAQAIVALWGSYLELSPSRHGLRGFAFGTLPEGKRKVGNLEIYDVKPLTVTGWHLPGSPTTVEERTPAIAAIHARFFTSTRKRPTTGTGTAGDDEPLTDEEVIDAALRAKNGARLQALLDGDFSGYPSASEADLAVCSFLAFYCGPNSYEQIDRIVRAHYTGFRPEKWDVRHFGNGDTYGKHTISIALEGRTEFYHRPLLWSPSRHEPLTEEEENTITLAQEREPDEDEEFPDAADGCAGTAEQADAATEEPASGTEEPASGTEEPASGTEEPASGTEEPGTAEQADAATEEPGAAPGATTATPKATPGTERTVYALPDILWQGKFAEAAYRMRLWTWEVWLGVFGALSARAHKNLHCHYHSDHLHGNTFCLLVNATGTGKNIVVNINRTLLDDYKIRTGLNSGPALVPMLTDDSLKSKEGRLHVHGVPLLLLSSEWSRIVQMSGIEHATLQEDLNDLFMRHYPWSQSRSHKNPSGGDIEISNPTLTIVGTTTRKLFHGALTDKALGSGTMNRYLIVPGSASFQAYTGISYRADGALSGLIDDLTTHTFGLGKEIRELYSPQAWDAFLAFQEEFIMPLQHNPDTSEALARLHLHLQHVAALYAWQTQSAQIQIAHFNAAKAVIEISHRFVTELLAEREQTFTPTKVQEVEVAMEKKVIAKLKQYPGLTRREFARKIANDTGGYAAWAKTAEALIRAGAIITKRTGKREELYVLPGF